MCSNQRFHCVKILHKFFEGGKTIYIQHLKSFGLGLIFDMSPYIRYKQLSIAFHIGSLIVHARPDRREWCVCGLVSHTNQERKLVILKMVASQYGAKQL